MKKIKFLLVILSLSFLTGCTASYNLTIDDNSVKEMTKIVMNNNEYETFLSDNNNKYFNMYFDDENNVGEEGLELPISGVSYYKFSQNDSTNTISYTGDFTYNNFKRSTIRTLGFKNTKFVSSDNSISITTSSGFTFPYEELTELTVNITSPYKVNYTNADKTNGNTLTWVINKNNANTKSISVTYITKEEELIINDKEEEKEKMPFKLILMIILLVLLVGFMISLIFVYKFKKNNNV